MALLPWITNRYKEIKKLFGRVAARKDLRRLSAIALCVLVYYSIGVTVFSFFTRLSSVEFYITGSSLFLPFMLSLLALAST